MSAISCDASIVAVGFTALCKVLYGRTLGYHDALIREGYGSMNPGALPSRAQNDLIFNLSSRAKDEVRQATSSAVEGSGVLPACIRVDPWKEESRDH